MAPEPDPARTCDMAGPSHRHDPPWEACMSSARFRLSLYVFLLLATPAHAEHLFQSNFLTQPIMSPFFFAPDFVLAGDINGDGLRDLYLGPHQGGLGMVAWGFGDGTFAPTFFSNFNDSTNEFGTLLLDLDRDGKSDLIEQRQGVGLPLKVSRGLGNGSF